MDAPPNRTAVSAVMKPWQFGLLMLGLLFLAFPHVLMGWQAFYYRDYGVLGYPFVHFHRESFWNGELPLWNPYSNCGAPFLAQWGTMTLYPGSLLYLLLPLPWSLAAFCFVHLALGGAGMYALARRWVGDGFPAVVAGTAFVFSGTMFSCLLWPNYTVALGWMPWVMLWVERSWREGGRWLVVAALAGTMQMLAGVPELALLTWFLLGTLGLTEGKDLPRWTVLRRLMTVAALVAALSAVQLLPFLELLEQSQRDRSFATSKWPMPLWGLANLLVPLFHTHPTFQGPHLQAGQEFFSSYYPGAAVLVLAVVATVRARDRRVWVLAGWVAFSLLMAWGEDGLLYSVVRRGMPLLGLARYPVKFMLLTAFALPLLAGWTVQALSAEAEAARTRWRTLAWAGGAALLLMGALVWCAWSHPYQSAAWDAADNARLAQTEWQFVGPNALGRAACLVAVLVLLRCLIRPRARSARWILQGAVVACLWVDVLTHAPPQNPTVPATAFSSGLWSAETPRTAPRLGEGRVLISPGAEQRLLFSSATNTMQDFLGKRLGLWSNLNLLEGIPKVNGSSTLQLREQAQVQALIYGGTNRIRNGLLEMLGVTLFSPAENPTLWVPRTNSRSIVSCGQAPVFADAAETLRGLAGPEFNPAVQVYLRPEDREKVPVSQPTRARVLSARFDARSLAAVVVASEPSLLVVAQSWCRGWRARIDGRERPLLQANHAFQAVVVPAGRHSVQLEYRDRSLVLGAVVSALTLAGCGGFWFWTGRRAAQPLAAITDLPQPAEPIDRAAA